MKATGSIASPDRWGLGILIQTTRMHGSKAILLLLAVWLAALATGGCGSPQVDPAGSSDGCGAAPEDPYGHAISSRPRDGSCRACPSPPETLRSCDAQDERDPTSLAASERLTDSDVILQGTLSFSPQAECGETDPGCACSQRCTAPLHLEEKGGSAGGPHVLLLHGGTWPWQDETLSQFVEKSSSVVSCSGNDLSLCCPFSLDPQRHTTEVEIHGSLQLVDDDGGQQYGIVVDDICRL